MEVSTHKAVSDNEDKKEEHETTDDNIVPNEAYADELQNATISPIEDYCELTEFDRITLEFKNMR